MLNILRRNAGSWVIKGILSFLALTFIWWGVGSYSQGQRDVAATIAGETISVTELGDTAQRLEKTYREVYGSAFTPELEKKLNLRRQALDELVRRKLLLSEAGALGISATDAEVRQVIWATPAFQVQGRFSENRYRETLAYNRVTPAEYEASKREEIRIRKVEGLFTASARVTESEARNLFDVTFRKVRLLVVSIDSAKIRGIAPPTDAELAEEYGRTKEQYRVPARLKLSVARFTPEVFARRITPSDQDIRSFYEEHPESFQSEESRLVYPLTIPYKPATKEQARKRAEKIAETGRTGKSAFDELARKLSRNKAGATWVTRKEMRPELAGPVFSAPVDAVVGPVDTGRGFAVVRINRIRFPERLPLAKVRSLVVPQVKHEKGKDEAVIRVYEAQAKAATSHDLAAACAPYGITPVKTGWTTDGKNVDVPSAVVQAALLLPSGAIGPVKTIGDTHYLFRVVAKENSRVPPLSAVRAQIVAAVAKDKREAAARARIEKAKSQAKTASELERNAKKAGLTVSTTPFFSPVSDPLPDVLAAAGDIQRDLLDLSAASPLSPKVYAAGTKFLTVAFVAEKPVDPKRWDAQKDTFMAQLTARKRSGAVDAFLAARLKQAKLTINPDAFK